MFSSILLRHVQLLKLEYESTSAFHFLFFPRNYEQLKGESKTKMNEYENIDQYEELQMTSNQQ